ncbi:hypothetical protein [Gallibacterium sp. AGMB14963]|nr:hypothetical protein [Gallibacterium sp. AGMB14963]MDA3979005.1 hypothetical protein [Gallibacterium sp. AGMB14963]
MNDYDTFEEELPIKKIKSMTLTTASIHVNVIELLKSGKDSF